MQDPVDHDRDHRIGARAPQVLTSGTAATPISPSVSSTTINTSPFFPDPSTVNTTTPSQAPHDNSKAVRKIIEYFFLVLALFVASIVIFRRLFYLRKRNQHRRELYNHDQERLRGHRPFPRTTGLPRVNLRSYPLFDGYFPTLPLPAASTNARRTRANDIDLGGRRFTSTDTEVDHDGFLRDKDVLPKYELFGGPPKYADLGLRQVLVTETMTLSPLPPAAAQSPWQNSGITLVEAETPSIQTDSSLDNDSRFNAIHSTDAKPVPSAGP